MFWNQEGRLQGNAPLLNWLGSLVIKLLFFQFN
jgi:hypothetical protein